ncbi:MAG: quaternary ammonium compound efflux SMR transporter SugE [Gammaproteobacteria bacterium]|nr:quaternary ammonium compound efflux SMR transporter SugE [Gammaproteobacteria bacterium]
MSWVILFVAGLLEIGWAIGLKYTDGFTKLWPTVGTVASLVASFLLLGLALKTLPVGTAYAIWVGIGAVGTALLGILLFGESTGVLKLVSLGLICAGIVGLKLAINNKALHSDKLLAALPIYR